METRRDSFWQGRKLCRDPTRNRFDLKAGVNKRVNRTALRRLAHSGGTAHRGMCISHLATLRMGPLWLTQRAHPTDTRYKPPPHDVACSEALLGGLVSHIDEVWWCNFDNMLSPKNPFRSRACPRFLSAFLHAEDSKLCRFDGPGHPPKKQQ